MPAARAVRTKPSIPGWPSPVKYTGRMSACSAASTSTEMTLRVVVTSRNGLPNSTRQPSRSCTQPLDAAASGRVASMTPTSRGISRVRRAAASEVAAVIHKTVEPENTTISVPASAGPISRAIAPSPSRSPISRSEEIPPWRTMAGSSASRAVMPGTSPSEPSTPNRMNQPRFSPETTSINGSAATAPAEIRSVTTEEVRRLIRSITTPMSRPANTAGTAVAAATAPAPRALPVTCSTISGRAIPASELPSSDSR